MPCTTPELQRAYQRDWIANRRHEFFRGKRCTACGATKELELDHIDPATKAHHGIWSWSADRRAAEILKCQVLCRECHILKTLNDNGLAPVDHGSQKMYARGCRCTPCKAAHAKHARDYRARVKARK